VQSSPILVVEDDPAVRRLIAVLLQDAGYEVRVAADCLQALERVDEGMPALITLDLALHGNSLGTGADGAAFLAEARRRGYTGRVVVVSALGARASTRSLHADAALEKPFDPEQLVRIVRNALRS
jgi:DNA-binding response OmpR family regulator